MRHLEEYIKRTYQVPCDIGRRILFEGEKKGVIIGFYSSYIIVQFDGEKTTCNLHPTWKVEYLEMEKKNENKTS